ncbi:MAG TPA: signal peptidase I [Phycisphaerae bacterium]|nr:signal peptidase I [Phycisphaerae bacterium]
MSATDTTCRVQCAAGQPVPSSPGWRRAARWGLRFVRNALAVVGLLFLVYHFCFEITTVISGSMAPTLQGEGGPGSDVVLFERVSYWWRKPQRWEVAQYETLDHMIVAKRVVGLPGERVAIVDHQPVIDGAPAPPPPPLAFLHYYAEARANHGRTIDCGDGYFFLGDDSIDSYDSRYEGPMPRSAIRSRAWLILWPPSRIGFVNAG